MLVLTRKTNQQIQIGENVIITILHVKGQSVRVGIEAPRQVRVVRSEIAELPVDTVQAEAGMALPATAESSEAGLPDVQLAGARRVKSPAKARVLSTAGLHRAQTGFFSSPLAGRVTAILESSGGPTQALEVEAAHVGREEKRFHLHSPSKLEGADALAEQAATRSCPRRQAVLS